MNALRCDRCGSYFTPLKTRLALTVERIHSVLPFHDEEKRFWNHDLCPKCQDELRDWWVAGRVRRVIIRDAEGERVGIYSTKKIVPTKFEEMIPPLNRNRK